MAEVRPDPARASGVATGSRRSIRERPGWSWHRTRSDAGRPTEYRARHGTELRPGISVPRRGWSRIRRRLARGFRLAVELADRRLPRQLGLESGPIGERFATRAWATGPVPFPPRQDRCPLPHSDRTDKVRQTGRRRSDPSRPRRRAGPGRRRERDGHIGQNDRATRPFPRFLDRFDVGRPGRTRVGHGRTSSVPGQPLRGEPLPGRLIRRRSQIGSGVQLRLGFGTSRDRASDPVVRIRCRTWNPHRTARDRHLRRRAGRYRVPLHPAVARGKLGTRCARFTGRGPDQRLARRVSRSRRGGPTALERDEPWRRWPASGERLRFAPAGSGLRCLSRRGLCSGGSRQRQGNGRIDSTHGLRLAVGDVGPPTSDRSLGLRSDRQPGRRFPAERDERPRAPGRDRSARRRSPGSAHRRPPPDRAQPRLGAPWDSMSPPSAFAKFAERPRIDDAELVRLGRIQQFQ